MSVNLESIILFISCTHRGKNWWKKADEMLDASLEGRDSRSKLWPLGWEQSRKAGLSSCFHSNWCSCPASFSFTVPHNQYLFRALYIQISRAKWIKYELDHYTSANTGNHWKTQQCHQIKWILVLAVPQPQPHHSSSKAISTRDVHRTVVVFLNIHYTLVSFKDENHLVA